MPQPTAGQQVARNLVELTRTYKTSDPVQWTQFRRAFKDLSKNDLSRVVVYLMEVVGSNDVAKKYLEGENKDLRELLKLNNIDPDAEVDDTPNTEATNDKVDTITSTGTQVGAAAKSESPAAGDVAASPAQS